MALKKETSSQAWNNCFYSPGHNGGDGAVIARELFLRGFYVQVWCPFPIKKTLTNNHLNYLTSIGVTKLVESLLMQMGKSFGLMQFLVIIKQEKLMIN